MKRSILYLAVIILCFSCNQTLEKEFKKPITDSISIFEIYLKDSVAVNHFSNFLRNTLELPVEWEPFDIFGNDVVYDAAFHLGNTTLELLSVNPPLDNIKEEAKYNRILFHSKNIDSSSIAISSAGIEHQPPYNFNIVSNNSELIIGKQINLDSISKLSNINMAFWQYLNAGYNFSERTIKGETKEVLNTKLDAAMKSNPMGILGLKEVHLSVNQLAIYDWRKLLGTDTANKWVLSEGPVISYTLTTENIGVDWITLRVQNLDKAKEFLSKKNVISTEKNRVAINPSKIYGLQIYIEE